MHPLTPREAELRWLDAPGRAVGWGDGRAADERPLQATATTLSCVLPTSGSHRAVTLLLPQLTQALARSTRRWELLVVAAGERDPAPLQAWCWLRGVRVGICEQPLAWVEALRAGLRHARGEAVLVADVGARHKLAAVPAMLSLWGGRGEVVFAEPPSGHHAAPLRARAEDAADHLMRMRAVGVGAIDSDLYLMDRRMARELLR
ncbi:MAG: hypothetical protein JNL30_14715 [Rubrivivax sp.]|nr:hypothetical protein [Rubrivivax sp.]